ncbi:hypothetical protein E8E11_004351 [Didymella keratinophila]|nr:hypothetical protein E8E11_004351 [Didymella keratinophila]
MTDRYVYNQVNGISISLSLLMTTTDTNYYTKLTLNAANQLVFVGSTFYDHLQENQKRLAADTGKSKFPGRMIFATQAGIDARTAWGGGVTPDGFVTCRRDTSSTPNGLIFTRRGDSASRVWVCGGTVSFANDVPSNSCYEVRWTIFDEGCGVVKMWSRNGAHSLYATLNITN